MFTEETMKQCGFVTSVPASGYHRHRYHHKTGTLRRQDDSYARDNGLIKKKGSREPAIGMIGGSARSTLEPAEHDRSPSSESDG